MRKSVKTGLIFIALIIGYGALVIHGIDNMQDWAWSGWALIPLAVLCGLGCAICGDYWHQEKEEKKKKEESKNGEGRH